MLNNFEKFSFPSIEKRKKKKKRKKEIKGRELRDHRRIIFATLYTIIKNKIGDIFLSGQNQCHITRVKKSYFCLVGGWWVMVVLEMDTKLDNTFSSFSAIFKIFSMIFKVV